MKTKLILMFVLNLNVAIVQAQKITVGGITYNLDSYELTAEITACVNSGEVVIPPTISYDGVNYDVTSLTAEFALNTYTITTAVDDSAHGTTQGDTMALYLDTITISATPNYGYHFVQWKDSGNIDNQQIKIRVKKPSNWNAIYMWTWETGKEGHWEEMINQEDDWYIYYTKEKEINFLFSNKKAWGGFQTRDLYTDTDVCMMIEGQYFDGKYITVTIDCEDSEFINPRQIVVKEDATYTAIFAKNTYTITTAVDDSSHGTAQGDTMALYLDTITISATPNYGYNFTQWNDGNTNNPREVVVTQDSVFTAMFANSFTGNTITYTAVSQLDGYNGSLDVGAATFGFAITSHTFSNGTGTITCGGEITMIGESAFRNCKGLTSITIPNSVTTIEGAAFNGCSGLTSVTIGNSVTTIGAGAFTNCISLTKTNYTGTIANWCKIKFGDGTANPMCYSRNFFINDVEVKELVISEGVDTIGNYAFYGCSGLTSVTIPNSVTTIGNNAFTNCKGLTSVTIPNSVTTIGSHAFFYCSGLTSVTIPNSVTTIGSGAFYNVLNIVYYGAATGSPWDAKFVNKYVDGYFVYSDATKTKLCGCSSAVTGEITIPNSVTTIGERAFQSYRGLTSITIPNSVTTIESWAFGDCIGLTSVTIPNSVTTIGIWAFTNCTGLTSVTIGNSVTTIGNNAFYNCTSLTMTNYTGTIANWCKIKFGNGTANPMCCSHNFFINDVEVKELVISEGVDTIGNYAFNNCSGLTSVTIPNSVTTIGSGAFSGCIGLTSVTIPNSVTTIGNNAFYNCTGLTSVTIPNSVTTIGGYAFYGCSSLTSVTIPNSVTTIGYAAFGGCSSLTSVTIGNSVTTIGGSAFSGCSGLTSVTCYATTPPTCGSSCFYNVDKSIPIYVTARSIDTYKNATGWKDFTNIQVIPDDFAVVTCIAENGTIEGAGKHIKGETCTLTIIPAAGYQFTQWNDGNTENPRSFIVTQDTTFIAQIDTAFSGQCGDDLTWKYNNGVLIISGTGAMYDYTQGSAPWMPFFQESISSLVINNGCTSIGNFAFYGLSNKDLKTIDLPNGIEQIGQYAFANCEYLKNLYLGLSLEKISANAFANDERLLYITCYAIEPPLLDESAFVNYDAYLSVPCESQADYKVSKGWKLFNKENISCIGAKETPITTDDVTVTPEDDKATLVWPADDQAAGYSIEISKDGVVFCTLKFNAQGQLTGIAFAPSRDGELRTMQAAEMTAKGWQFTVTGLTPGSKYVYTVDVINAQQQSIKQYTGEFTTTGGISTDWNQLTDSPVHRFTKIIKDNHLLIFRGDKIYNAAGVLVK